MRDLNMTSGYSNRETEIAAWWIENELLCDQSIKPRTIELLSTATERGRITLARELKEAFESQPAPLPSMTFTELFRAAKDNVDWMEVVNRLWEETRAPLIQAGHLAGSSRAQTIAEGALMDVTCSARKAGFKLPVALTHAAWQASVAASSEIDSQDETSRLTEVLSKLLPFINGRRRFCRKRVYRFTVSVRTGEQTSYEVELKSLYHAGDDGEPVITIKLPDEF